MTDFHKGVTRPPSGGYRGASDAADVPPPARSGVDTHNLAGVTYRPFDQDTWLTDPPWAPSDIAVQEWEAAHGHDVRLKCLVEHGCLVVVSDLERQVEQARSVAVALEQENAELQRQLTAVSEPVLDLEYLGRLTAERDGLQRRIDALTADPARPEPPTPDGDR